MTETLRNMTRHPLFVAIAALLLSGSVGVVVATEVGRARDNAQDAEIAQTHTDIRHVKLDADKTSVDVARAEERLTAIEQAHAEQLREINTRLRDFESCLRSACWRRQ